MSIRLFTRNSNIQFSWNLLWLFLFYVGFGIFFLLTPKYLDDYWYMEHTADWFLDQGVWNPDEGGNVFEFGFPWEGVGKIIYYHFMEDNTRVCNMAAPIMLLFPKWVGSLVSLVAWIYTVYIVFRMTSVSIRKSWLVGVGLGLWVLTPLWYNVMGTVVFQYNYVVSGGLCLWLLMVIKNKPRSVAGMIGFVFLAILTAVWHEGFAMPMFVSLAVMVLCYKECRNRWVITATVIMLAGLIYHFWGGPSTMTRANYGYFGFSVKRLIHSFWYHKSWWVFIIVLIIYLCRKGFKSYIDDRLLVFMTVSLICNIGLTYFTQIERSGWWGDMAAVIMTLQMLRCMDGKTIAYRGWRAVIGVIMLVAAGFQLIAADIYTFKYAREYPKIIKQWLDEPNDSYFSELHDYPWIGLPFMQMVDDTKFMWPEFPKQFYWQLSSDKLLLYVIPEGLRNMRLEDAVKLEGNLGFYKYGPYVVAPTETPIRYWMSNIDIDYGWFKVYDRYVICIPFTSEADGRRYVYMVPVYNQTEFQMGNIKGINRDMNKVRNFYNSPSY